MRGSQAAPARRAPVTWLRHWESTIDAAAHAGLAALLARGFPAAEGPADGRSWVGARPELRVVGCHEGRPVAHAAVIRRFLRTPATGTSMLVGDVGLVAVDPDHRGTGLGAALLDAVTTTLAGLDLPYGFLTCGDHVRPFYERSGWHALTDRPVHGIGIDHRVEHGRSHGMLLPVGAALDAWPPGPVHRDGQEI